MSKPNAVIRNNKTRQSLYVNLSDDISIWALLNFVFGPDLVVGRRNVDNTRPLWLDLPRGKVPVGDLIFLSEDVDI